jgi:hypothetical protein
MTRLLAIAALVSALSASTAWAQQTGRELGKDCQTVRTCNFARGAAVRGCLSSYSCRRCNFVRTCRAIAGRRQCDYQARCGWRGA